MQKVVSNRQQAASRRNARKSTGPRSPEGKARAAKNAFKHGILAAQVVADGDTAERPEDFHALLESLRQRFDPRDVIEHALVERVAACFWRLRRAQRFELGALHEARKLHEAPRRPAYTPERAVEDASFELESACDLRKQREDDLNFLQALDLDDPHILKQARHMLSAMRLRYSAAVHRLPARKTCEILLRELPRRIREYDEDEIPALQRKLEQAREETRRPPEDPAPPPAIPVPDDVVKLVRYENMLDRQLHRALTELDRRRDPARSDRKAKADPK